MESGSGIGDQSGSGAGSEAGPTPETELKTIFEKLNGNPPPLERIRLLQTALDKLNTANNRDLWARLQLDLGRSLSDLTSGDLLQNGEDAIGAFRQALQVYTRDSAPQDWAFVMMCLGNALDSRIAGDPAQNVEEAIQAYSHSLEVYTQESFPNEWALTKMNLGIAYHNRQLGDIAGNVELSIAALKDAGSIITAQNNPRLWIDLLVNFSNAYTKRQAGDAADNLEIAIQLGEEALASIPPRNLPLLWARTANNLATVLLKRIQGKTLENLQAAEQLLLRAEKICTPEAAILEWIKIQLNLTQVFYKRVSLSPSDSIDVPKILKEMCGRIWRLYGRTNNLSVLDQAILSFQAATEHTPIASPDLPLYLIRLGICFEDHGKFTNNTQDQDRAVSLYERAVALTPAGTPQLPRNLNSLSLALATRFSLLGKMEDLNRSLEIAKDAIKQSESFSEEHLIYIRNLMHRLEDAHETEDDPAMLQDLADCYSEMSVHASINASDRVDYLGKLGYCLMRKYGHTASQPDLDKAIEHYEKAAALVVEKGTRHSLFLAAGSARYIRFQSNHQERDLEKAAEYFEEANNRAPDETPEKIAILNNATAANVALYELNNDLKYLDQAIVFLGQMIDLDKDGKKLAGYRLQMTQLRRNRYKRTNDDADLRALVEQETQEFDDNPESDYLLISICLDLCHLYDRSESMKDLESGIRYCRALVMQAAKPELQLTCQTILIDLLLRHYRLTRAKSDLEEALERSRDASVICPQDSPLRNSICAYLGTTLEQLYERTKADEYRNESAKVLASLQERIDAGEKADANILTILGHFLSDRFAVLGDLRDLSRALEINQRALDEASHKTPAMYTNLGNVLSDLYSATGDLQRLNQAIQAWEEAVNLSNQNSPYHATRLNNLGSGWLLRSRHSHAPGDLDAAIRIIRQSVDATDPSFIHLPIHLSYLGQSLLARYELSNNAEDLKGAAQVFQNGLSLADPGSLIYSQLVVDLGQNLRLLYEATNETDFLSNSIKTLEHGLETMEPTSRFYATALAFMGADYQALHECDGLPESRKLMEDSYRRACMIGGHQNSSIVLNCSQWWGGWAVKHEEWAIAAEAYGYGVPALDALYRAQVMRADKETWLSEAQRVHSMAAYASARAGRLPEAVSILEQGRARMLVETLERHRAELMRLPQLGYSAAFQDYTQAVDLLSYLEKQELLMKPESGHADITGEIRSAQVKLDEAVNAIQDIPGYQHLFASPSFEQILGIYRSAEAAIGSAPIIIYLVLTSAGGMAILLEDGNLTPVPFDLTEADLESLLIVADGGTLIGGYLSVQFSAGNREETLNHVLDTLGSKMMAPISAHMGILPEKADAAISRTVILIPTGRLSLLPLHAVPWRANGGSRILLDYFNVAFVPSLRSLSHCLEALNSCSATGMKFCAVGNPLPLPDGYASLEFARAEVEEISRNFADSALFCEETAVLPAVEECLDQGMYLHFSCHGEFDPNDPMLSGILLSGGRFTLRKLVTRPELKKARLVVLSACQTAITEFNRLPEEVIGLPSGFIQAGASGVVGSLWPVNDISTALLMIKFYQYHLAGDPLNSIPPLSPVSALRKAQLWLRDLTNADLADLFDEYRKAAAKRQGGMPQDLAQSQFRAHALNPPGEHPYSQPYYWAAFAFFGM